MNAADSTAALVSLEFAAVLDDIAARAAGSLAAEKIRSLVPLTEQSQIETDLRQVGELLSLLRRGDSINVPPVPDSRASLKRLAVPGSVLDLGELAQLKAGLAAGRIVFEELTRLAESVPEVAALRVPIPDRAIERRLERAVGDDGELLDSASPALAAARREVHVARDRLVSRLERFLADLGSASGGGVTVRGGRYVVPVRRDARTRPEGIIHDESGTSGTLFIEPTATIGLGNALREAYLAEERAVLQVLRDLTDLLRPEREVVSNLLGVAVVVDTLFARAKWANEYGGEVPGLTGVGGDLTIIGGRHPLLLARGIEVVPFDLTMSDGERTLLISGPNTGGKTVLLKAAGLLILLAQSGVVPSAGQGSQLPMLTGIFVDIGDNQSLQADLSTFSAHVAELRRILERADHGSMVILDEVGSGTDPAEGGALAMAVLGELTERLVLTLATTHLGSLKSLATEVRGVVNGSLQFDGETLSPTYQFTKGIPGRSYGLAIARRLGVSPEVLKVADGLVPETERELDRLLATVEARHQEQIRVESDLAGRAAEVERREELSEIRAKGHSAREAELAKREKEAEREQGKKAKAYLLAARKKVEEALALAKGAADEAGAKEARRLIEDGVREEALRLEELVEAPTGEAGSLSVGCTVRLGTGANGTLRELRGDGRALVEVGSMRLVVKSNTLTRISTPAPRAEPVTHAATAFTTNAEEVTELDLRGMRADAAEREVVAGIDAATLADQQSFRIIHGMGTGVLRDVVRRVLNDDKRVASFDFAPRQLGGTGVTIVVIR